MKKTATYYFLLLAVVNGIIGHCHGKLVERLLEALPSKGVTLPQLAVFFLDHAWWPYFFAALCVVGVVCAAGARVSDKILLHALALMLTVEVIVLFLESACFMAIACC